MKSLYLNLAILLVLLAAAACPATAGAETTVSEGRTIYWSVSGVSNLELGWTGMESDVALFLYLADFPPEGEPVVFEATWDPPVCGWSPECEIAVQGLAGGFSEWSSGPVWDYAPEPPCRTLMVRGGGPWFYYVSGRNQQIDLWMEDRSYTQHPDGTVTQCFSPAKVHIVVQPRNAPLPGREDDRLFGGPEDNPGRTFDGGDEGDGPGSGEEGADSAEDVSEVLETITSRTTNHLISVFRDNGRDAGGGTGGDDSGGETCRMGLPSWWVDTLTLTPVVKDTDFALRGRGPGVRMTRTWNADLDQGPDAVGMFGRGWSFTYESSVLCRSMYQPAQGVPITFCGTPEIWAELTRGSGQRAFFKSQTMPDINDPNPPSVDFSHQGTGRFDTLHGADLHSQDMAFTYTDKVTRTDFRYAQATVLPKNFGVFPVSMARLSSITDRAGNTVTVSHNPDGTISAVTDAAGRATTFDYDANGRCTSMTTPDGRTAFYEYDADAHLVRTTDLLGTVTEYTYDATHRLTSVTVGDRTVAFTWMDAAQAGWDRLASVTDPEGGVTAYSLDPFDDQATLITDALERTTRHAFQDGLATAVTDPLGHTATFTWANGLLQSATDPLNNTLHFNWDERGNLTGTSDAAGYTRTFVYDGQDNLTALTNALDETFSFTWDARNLLTRVTGPDGRSEHFTHDAWGQLTALADAAGYTRTVSRDAWGNIKTVTDPLGYSTRGQYGSHGILLTAIGDARGYTTQYVYDDNHRVTRVIHPDGSFREYAYDACSLVSVTDENGHVTALDNDRRLSLVRAADPLGNALALTYDAAGDLAALSDPQGYTTTFTRDGAGRRTGITDTAGGATATVLDGNGHIVGLTDPGGRTYGYSRDARGLATEITDPLGGKTFFTRDALGRVVSKTNARGQVLILTYDSMGRWTEKAFDGTVAASRRYGADGRLTAALDAHGNEVALVRNPRGEVTAMTYPDGKSLAVAYDPSGNLTTLTLPDGQSLTTTWDNRNRPERMAWGSQWMEFTFDPAGNLVKETRSNGVTSTYTHDAANRLVSIRHERAGQVLASMTYERDAGGNIVRETRALPVPGYPGAGTVEAPVDQANRMTSLEGRACAYDADGNMLSLDGPGGFSMVHDAQNRLVSLTRNGSTAEFTYNGLGRLASRTENDLERRYYHDPLNRLVYEEDAGGGGGAGYVHAGRRLCAVEQALGGTCFLLFDQAGNTIALTDETGTVTGAWGYDPFGEIQARAGSPETPYTFGGAWGVRHEGGGLYFMTHRWYYAPAGRFLEKDPLGLAAGTNLHAYVGNNPVNRVDPLGLVPRGSGEPDASSRGMGIGESHTARFTRETAELAGGAYSRVLEFLQGKPEVPGNAEEPNRSLSARSRVRNIQGTVMGALEDDTLVTLAEGQSLENITRLITLEDSTVDYVRPSGEVFAMPPNTMVFLDPRTDTMENPCSAAPGIR